MTLESWAAALMVSAVRWAIVANEYSKDDQCGRETGAPTADKCRRGYCFFLNSARTASVSRSNENLHLGRASWTRIMASAGRWDAPR